MIVKIKRLTENAVLPVKAHANDFCYDLVATSCEEVEPGVYKYGTGISLQVVRSAFGDMTKDVCITLRSRSSIWKTGMILSNGSGTIDEGYTGEIFAVFYHLLPNLPKYEVGDRIGQIHVQLAPRMDFEEVDDLADTERGDGGYGSTGQ